MDMTAIRFGIEIETIKPTGEQTAAAIHSVVGGTIRHVGYPASYDPRRSRTCADASGCTSPTRR